MARSKPVPQTLKRTRDGCLDPTLFAANKVACLRTPPIAFPEVPDCVPGTAPIAHPERATESIHA